MGRLRKLTNIMIGAGMIALAVLMCLWPEDGYLMVITIIGFTLVAGGIRGLYFYVTMARFMVGGKYILYRSVILMQFGFFTWSLNDVPKFYVILYLAVIHAFTGAVEMLNARESRQYGSPRYKRELIEGGINLLMAILCLIFIRHLKTAVFIYSSGLLWSGIMRINKAFRRQEMVYIR